MNERCNYRRAPTMFRACGVFLTLNMLVICLRHVQRRWRCGIWFSNGLTLKLLVGSSTRWIISFLSTMCVKARNEKRFFILCGWQRLGAYGWNRKIFILLVKWSMSWRWLIELNIFPDNGSYVRMVVTKTNLVRLVVESTCLFQCI